LRDFEKTLEESKSNLEKTDEKLESNNSSIISKLEDTEIVSNLTADNSSMSPSENSTGGQARSRMVCNNTLPVEQEPLSSIEMVGTPGLELMGAPDRPLWEPQVHLLNGSHYQLSLASEFNASVGGNRTTAAICSLTLFFAEWCDFSASAAPHYNALARAFPQLPLYAVDSSRYHGLNTQYGVMAVPTLLVFHNSRPLYKYNLTEYSLNGFKEFVSLVTGIQPINDTDVREQDWIGPVPSVPVKPHNVYLWLAIVFSLCCGLLEFSKSPFAGHIVTGLRNAWREAEIQHEHQD